MKPLIKTLRSRSPTSGTWRGAAADAPRRLCLTEKAIQTAARRFGPADSLPKICFRAARRELRLRFERHINFRRAANADACRAYEEMQIDDFVATAEERYRMAAETPQ